MKHKLELEVGDLEKSELSSLVVSLNRHNLGFARRSYLRMLGELMLKIINENDEKLHGEINEIFQELSDLEEEKMKELA